MYLEGVFQYSEGEYHGWLDVIWQGATNEHHGCE